jgi:hypothetical protein
VVRLHGPAGSVPLRLVVPHRAGLPLRGLAARAPTLPGVRPGDALAGTLHRSSSGWAWSAVWISCGGASPRGPSPRSPCRWG